MYSIAALVATGAILPLLGVAMVCLRFYVRLHFHRNYIGIDDYFIVLGSLFVCAMGAIQIADSVLGDQSPEAPSTESRSTWGEYWDYIVVIVEKPAYGFIKLSVLFFYRRIFAVHDTFRRINNIMIVLITLWMIAFLFEEIFVCGTDFRIMFDDRKDAPHHCVNHGVALLAFAATDVVGDVIIVSMPFLVIFQLTMSMKEKVAVSFVFAMAFLSSAAGMLRLGFVAEAYNVGQMGWVSPPAPNPKPYAMQVVNPVFWTLVEVSVGVIAACLPPLGPLIRATPSPSKFFSSARRKMSLSSGKVYQSSLFGSNDLEKGKSLDSFGDHKSSRKGSEEPVPALPNESMGVSHMRASVMWDEANGRWTYAI